MIYDDNDNAEENNYDDDNMTSYGNKDYGDDDEKHDDGDKKEEHDNANAQYTCAVHMHTYWRLIVPLVITTSIFYKR